jgi:hypothetical protein
MTALAAEDLLALARERTGLADFGDPIFREGLDVLLEDVVRAQLSDLGRMVWRGRILGHLVQRLRVEDSLARLPRSPRGRFPRRSSSWRCRGLPRTGTTALSHLLAQDEHRYRLEDWGGLDGAGVHAAFSFYTERCGVKSEE